MSIDQLISRAPYDKISDANNLERSTQRAHNEKQRVDDAANDDFHKAIREQAKRSSKANDDSKPQRTESSAPVKDQAPAEHDTDQKNAVNAVNETPVIHAAAVAPIFIELDPALNETLLNPIIDMENPELSLEPALDVDAELNNLLVPISAPAIDPNLKQTLQPETELVPKTESDLLKLNPKVFAQLTHTPQAGSEAEQSDTPSTQAAPTVAANPLHTTAPENQQQGNTSNTTAIGSTPISDLGQQRNEAHEEKSDKQNTAPLVNNQSVGNQQNTTTSFAQVVQQSDTATVSISEMKAQNTGTSQQAPEMNAMDKAVAKQIDRAVVHQLQHNQKVIQIRLTPPELGTVKIEIMEQNGRLTVRMQAEDESVRLSLERALPQLRNDLRASNAPIADVQLTDQSYLMDRQHRQSQSEQRRRRQDPDAPTFSIDGVAKDNAQNLHNPIKRGITIDNQGVHGLV